MDWLVENKAEFEKVVRNKLHKDVIINWKSGIRLILIAKSFELWDKFAVNRIKEEVELYEYTLYENSEIKLEKATLPKDFRGAARTSITSNPEYSVKDLMDKIENGEIRDIVSELREKLKLIADDIEERATKTHIVFKSSVNFAAIYTQKKQYWFAVKLTRKEVKKQFGSLDIRPHRDKVFTRIRCNNKTDIAQLITLAEQAYENTL
jgi:predicted transport protein